MLKQKGRHESARATHSPCLPVSLLLWPVWIVYLELVLRMHTGGHAGQPLIFVILFSCSIGLLLGTLLSVLGAKAQFVAGMCVNVAFFLLFSAQAVFFKIFGSLFSLSMAAMGGNALTSFWKETLLGIKSCAGTLALFALPWVSMLVLRLWRPAVFHRPGKKILAIAAALAVALHIGAVLCLGICGTGYYTPYSNYRSDDVSTDQSAASFGMLTALRLELKHMLFPSAAQPDTALVPVRSPSPASETPSPQTSDAPEPVEYHTLDIDFDALNALTDDASLLEMNAYFSSLSGTAKNEYTGLFKDCNLITICAESFSPYLIDPQLTPTLYKLSTEGIVFTNYYNSFPNITTNGEYAFCTGLFPDMSRSQTAPSFYASRNSYLPNALGNLFSSQRGVSSFAFHNYDGSYYGRNLTHPNMGYTFISAGNGMQFSSAWPASDLEMMEQSVDDYIGTQPFHAYYMTFSGHIQYDCAVNAMCSRNYSLVESLPYSYTTKCYIACNLELEKALSYLMERLEQAGVADNTVIVLASDHYPYGLNAAEYNELAGETVDTTFGKYKSSFLCWKGGLDTPVIVDDYCCNVDILPTLLNLFGFDYDSRLLAGEDVLSPDALHMAILANQSFLTKDVRFDSSTNTALWADGVTGSEARLQSLIQTVKNKFTLSTQILNKAYYDFVFKQDTLSIPQGGWISEEAWNGTEDEGAVGAPGSAVEPLPSPLTEEAQPPVPDVPADSPDADAALASAGTDADIPAGETPS